MTDWNDVKKPDQSESMIKAMIEAIYSEYEERFSDCEFVFGCGPVRPRLLLIGEAPGREEVKLARPFSGPAGKNLDEFLELAGISRDDIYITNAIKYRLSKVNPKTGKLSNRPAAREEILSSRSYLLREIEMLCPYCIATLGNVPLRAVLGDFSANIGESHGKPVEIKAGEQECLLFPLYHPASVIYNRSLKEICREDILKLREIVNQE
ncbi:MAG TPA: uracil-DNA glycosylase [Clostridia bacterium]|nr:uracil-DNA glycosylase [Clostridia bacterium]